MTMKVEIFSARFQGGISYVPKEFLSSYKPAP
jgi:hypothetical protein